MNILNAAILLTGGLTGLSYFAHAQKPELSIPASEVYVSVMEKPASSPVKNSNRYMTAEEFGNTHKGTLSHTEAKYKVNREGMAPGGEGNYTPRNIIRKKYRRFGFRRRSHVPKYNPN